MEISPATIDQLDDVVFLFDQYRIFYRQPSDLDSAYHYLLKID